MVIALFGVAAITALGSAVLFVLSFVLLVVRRLHPPPLRSNKAEAAFLATSVVAAIAGSALLFTVPAYTSSRTTVTSTLGGEPKVTVAPETGHSFYAVNGPKVISLFTVPIAFTFLPLLVARWRGRALVASAAAFALAAMSIVGMSGFGTFFAPAALFLLLSGFMALRRHGAQPTVQGSTSPPSAEPRP